MTPERNLVKDKAVCQQQLTHNKVVSQTAELPTKKKDTPQMKALRERMLERQMQKSAAKGKVSSVEKGSNSTLPSTKIAEEVKGVKQVILRSSKRSPSKLVENETVLLSSSSKSTGHDKLVSSLDQNDNKRITLTPQMRVLQEKIQQRRSGTSNVDKEVGAKSRQQRLQVPNEISEMQEKQEKSMPNRESAGRNKNNVKQGRSNGLKKNLAKERMQKLRRSLSLEKKIAEEIVYSNTSAKSLQRLNKSLPSSHCT